MTQLLSYTDLSVKELVQRYRSENSPTERDILISTIMDRLHLKRIVSKIAYLPQNTPLIRPISADDILSNAKAGLLLALSRVDMNRNEKEIKSFLIQYIKGEALHSVTREFRQTKRTRHSLDDLKEQGFEPAEMPHLPCKADEYAELITKPVTRTHTNISQTGRKKREIRDVLDDISAPEGTERKSHLDAQQSYRALERARRHANPRFFHELREITDEQSSAREHFMGRNEKDPNDDDYKPQSRGKRIRPLVRY